MARYRKRPVVIEATQWFKRGDHPAVLTSVARPECGVIPTLEGFLYVEPGDYVITGVAGEQYPCKPDIFERTYEAVS